MPTHEWLAAHVRSSQYFLQVVKCNNTECCTPMVSALKSILPDGFLHAPLSVTNTEGLKLDEVNGTFLSLFQRLSTRLTVSGLDEHESLPYDFCCPTVKGYINNRTCSVCKQYFPSVAMVTEHKRQLHPRIKVSVALRCRPVRIAAKRQRELMAIIAAGKYNELLL